MTTLYVLELEQHKYYIGKTSRPVNERIFEHIDNNGSEWTKKYKALNLIEIVNNIDKYDEDKYVKKYMDTYGINNVRGGSYVSIDLPDYQIKSLEAELCTSNNKCFRCLYIGHLLNLVQLL